MWRCCGRRLPGTPGVRYVNLRIARGEALSTFGRIIADARKALGMSQKELAGRTRKGGGDSISPQYFNDIEHDRRNLPSEFIIEQLAGHLGHSKEHLIAAAGLWPADLEKSCPSPIRSRSRRPSLPFARCSRTSHESGV